jgi:hypothetical protein
LGGNKNDYCNQDSQHAASFFDEFRKPPAPPAPPRTYLPEEQIVRPQINIKLPTVFRAVLKTGLNLVAHIAGSSVAANNAFDELRSELFDLESDDAIMRRCRFLGARPRWLSWLPSDFPPPANELQHRLMLDVAGGKIRFRIRLYGHLGYKGWLGPATQSIVAKIPTSRVIVNFDTTGIELVDTWPTDKT